jgi:hypothetical protein
VFLGDLLVALFVAMLLTVLFSVLLGAGGPWSGYWIYFLVILLVAWVAGMWVRPFGPTVWGVYWFPVLLFGLIAALLIAAVTKPARPPGETSRPAERSEGEEEALAAGAAVSLGVFFWFLLLVLLFALVIAYL